MTGFTARGWSEGDAETVIAQGKEPVRADPVSGRDVAAGVLCYRAGLGRRSGSGDPDVADCLLAALAFAVCLYPVLPIRLGSGGGNLTFLAYSYYGGGLLPQNWSIAQGLNFDEIVGALYNDASGFYGVPLDAAASYIVLFAIYAALLDLSRTRRFFINLSLTAFGRSRTAPRRAGPRTT